MPEFEMNGKEAPDFQSLDKFTQSYIEAAFWTSEQDGDDETTGIPHEAGFTDLAPEALEKIVSDCGFFQAKHKKLLEMAYRWIGYDESQAGHDFWLTRCHHGCGFWDRGLKHCGDKLTDAAHAEGESSLYVGDDGKVYVE